MRSVLGGWQISGVTVAQSGNPVNATYSPDTLGLGGGTTNRPDKVSGVNYPKKQLAWFNPTAFAAPVAPWNGGGGEGFGDSGKDTIVGPGLFNWNLSLFKEFQLISHEGPRIQLRAESYNTFNHTEWNNIDTGFTDSNFGQITHMTRVLGSLVESSFSSPVLVCFTSAKGPANQALFNFCRDASISLLGLPLAFLPRTVKQLIRMENQLKFSIRFWLLLFLICSLPVRQHSALAQSDPRLHAFALEQQGQNEQAEQAWHDILAGNPRNAEAFAHLGLLEAHQGRYDAAINYYRKALAITPTFPGVQTNLGLALFKTSQFRAAAQAFKAQLAKDPGNERLTILLGMSYYGMADYSTAVPYLKSAAARDPQNLSLRLTLAHSCLWAKQFACVMEVYKQILSLNAESAEADILAGEALDGQGDTNGAIEQFRAAERANPREPNVHFGLGYLLWKQRQYPEAKKEFEAELSFDPQHGQARAYLGDVLVRQNDYVSAEPQLKQAIAADPTLPLPYLDLGIIYASSGRDSQAIAAFQKTIALDPNDVDSHWRLAKLYQSMGRTEEAKVEFARVSAIKEEQIKNPKHEVLDIR